MSQRTRFPAFYFVDKVYHRYIQNLDHHVTNIEYANREKFVFGVVMETRNNICYFVPVTSYSKSKQDNILIKIEDHHTLKTVGSLRFNYMFPVPLNCLTPVNFKDTGYFSNEERVKVEKEYLYIKKKIGIRTIQRKAKEVYDAVISGRDAKLTGNCCNFLLLEQACMKYIETLNKIERPEDV
jgi:protein AbiQ